MIKRIFGMIIATFITCAWIISTKRVGDWAIETQLSYWPQDEKTIIYVVVGIILLVVGAVWCAIYSWIAGSKVWKSIL